MAVVLRGIELGGSQFGPLGSKPFRSPGKAVPLVPLVIAVRELPMMPDLENARSAAASTSCLRQSIEAQMLKRCSVSEPKPPETLTRLVSPPPLAFGAVTWALTSRPRTSRLVMKLITPPIASVP